MFRFDTIVFLIIVASMILTACQPSATPFVEEEFAATEAPAETEAPAATEPPAAVATDEPGSLESNTPDSVAVSTSAAGNESDSSASSGSSAQVIEITNDNLGEEVDQSSLPVLLYFWAPSNDASAALQPALEEVANEYAGRVKVASVNLDDYAEIGYYYTIFTDGPLPILVLIIDGNQEPWLEGATSKDEITNMLDQRLDNSSSSNESGSLPAAQAVATVVEITSDNFAEEVLQSPEPVLIHFWAAWSGPSRVIKPALEEIANEYADRVKVVEINVDDYPDLVAQFGIEQLPTLVIANGGNEQARIEGVTSKDEITDMLAQQLP